MTFRYTAREVKEFRELFKNAIKRIGHRLSFSVYWRKPIFGGSICGPLMLPW